VIARIVLKDSLVKRGMTQKELALTTGLRPNAVSRLCKGYADRVELTHLSKIAKALEITDMNELIRLEED
jgi:DNA-binding Xre family transcriptional regulator